MKQEATILLGDKKCLISENDIFGVVSLCALTILKLV